MIHCRLIPYKKA